MRKCRPSKWLPWGAIGVGFPLLCAALISDKFLNSDVTGRAQQALAGSDLTKWAQIDLNGRIATVTGKTTNAVAPDEVMKLVAGTYGVRQVINKSAVEPLTLVAPTIEAISATAPVAEIKGTWPEGAATTLSVKVGDSAYTLPGSPELTSSAGNWLLKLATPLPEGSYDVTASASVDSDGATVLKEADAPAKIVVDIPEPVAAPVVTPEPAPEMAPESAPESAPAPEPAPDAAAVPDTTPPAVPVIALNNTGATEARTVLGTWAEGDAAKLTASLEGRSYVFGQDKELNRSDNTPGTFLFAPDTATLAPGKYNVEFAVADAAGNAATVIAENAIIIPEPPKVEPAPEPAPQAAPEPAQVPAQEPVQAAAPAPVTLAAPTVTAQLDLTGAPIVRGTWPDSEGTSLVVGLAGKTYELGTSANLARDGAGKWKLLPSAALKDGIYDVTVTARNGDAEAKDQGVAELEVDATLPAAPTVTVHASDTAPAAIAGTFDSQRTTSLKVAVPELKLAAELGTPSSPLTADGDTWSLALPQPVAPGTYNVVVTSTDKRGRSVEDAGAGEIVISAPHEAAPKSDAPFDCNAVMTRISTVFPMRFIYNTVDFQERFGLSVSQYAALLKDARCGALKVEVGGHADERGTDAYNEELAERRAARVRDMLVEAGVATDRISVASYGESMPVSSMHDEEGWSINRRVEIKILK